MQARALLRRSLHDRVLITFVAALALMIIWYATGLGPRSIRVTGAWVFIAAVHLGLTFVAARLSRVPGLTPGARRFWRGVTPAGLIYLVGDVAQLVLSPTRAAGGPVQLAALSLGSAWLGVVLLTAPLGLTSRRERQRFWLDVATVMAAAAVVGWYLIAPARSSPLAAAGPVLMGPVVLLLCVFVVAKLTISGTAPFTRWTAGLGVLAAVVKSAADAVGSLDMVLPVFLALTVTSHALLVIAIRVGYLEVTGDPQVLRAGPRRPYSLLPYGAIAVTYVLLTVAVVRQDQATVPIALGGAALSTALVVVRQLAAFRDNDRLVDELRSSLAERDDLAARLRHQAFHDGLTGLPNRALFTERLESALAAGAPVTVMLVDLDDFKLVNDAWGHAAGDLLLREIATRLRACVRADDLVARLGGDEFAILLAAPPSPDADLLAAPPSPDAIRLAAPPSPEADLQDIGTRLVEAAKAPVTIDGGSARVGASIGIAVAAPATETGAAALLREADHAMYEVKRSGKGAYAISGDFTAPKPAP